VGEFSSLATKRGRTLAGGSPFFCSFSIRFGILFVSPLFSLFAASVKEKSSQKRNRDEGISRSAERAKRRRLLTLRAFEKARPKLFCAAAE
jgi:hypothetical protein